MQFIKFSIKQFQQFAAGMVAYSLIVILWGAFVRISNSGDGCGNSWPLCHNAIIPKVKSLPTWIEFGHRLTSGLYGLLVLALIVMAFVIFKKGHFVRKAAIASGVLTITEALLGARLVLAGLVGSNDSLERAITMSVHLVNSLFLVATLIFMYDWAKEEKYSVPLVKYTKKTFVIISLLIFLIIGCSGTVAALSTTLYPAESLLSGILADFSKSSHFLVRVRITHPLAATFLGIFLFSLAYLSYLKVKDECLRFRTTILMGLIATGIGIGYSTLFLLSPLFLKLLHLSWAYFIWTAIVLSISRSLQISFQRVPRECSTS
ncbi:MAG: COX15/CtaA family protein [Bdellovibrionales bacterium]|nr:COX15/CtaA family protein [Bdellovibrionales bacterium]